MGLEVLAPEGADYDEIAVFQRVCFEEVSGAGERKASQVAGHYSWKYTMTGKAKIAMVRNGGQIISMCAACPVELRTAPHNVMGWQLCDIATRPSERGKGYFSNCLESLSNSIPDHDVLFCFPNSNSLPLLTKRRWRVSGNLSFFGGVILNRSACPQIVQITRFERDHDIFLETIEKSRRLQLNRSSSYLNGRYNAANLHPYACFVIRGVDGYQGCIVLRATRVFGIPICVIMDVFSAHDTAERALISQAGHWAATQGCVGVLTANNTRGRFGLVKFGLLPIPNFAVPRPLTLMTSDRSAADSWWSQIGDWDGF